MKCIILSTIIFGYGLSARAQAPGSVTTYGGSSSSVKSIASGGTSADASETLYIGPGTYVIDGTWEIYSKNIVIDPAAVIGGMGNIQLYNPSVAGGTASRNFIDGNNNSSAMDVNMVINNASGIEITEIAFPSDLTGAGFTNNTGNNTVYLGKDLNLAVDGADVRLDADVAGDLRFDADATISNYSAARMVITNNVNVSHVVKDAGGTSFVYPVGTADGDYTPASITGTGTYHVSVKDYSSPSPQIGAPGKGMYRTWHVYGSTATSVTLTHNIITNGASYTDNTAFITRYLGSVSWTSSATTDYTGTPGQHTNTGSIAAGIPSTAESDGSYLSKTSDKNAPLPVALISFDAANENGTGVLKWATSEEANSRGFAIQYSTTAKEWRQIGYVSSLSNSGYSSAVLNYDFAHALLQPGKNYYRLKMEDLDGSYSFSTIRVINSDELAVLSVFPNPVVDVMTVSGIKGGELQLYDQSGKIVYLPGLIGLADGKSADLSRLVKGVYFLRVISAENGVNVLKFVKQ